MTVPIPLSVRLVTGRSDVHVSTQLRDLWFRETAIGGFASSAISLDRPLDLQPDEIAHYGRVYIYDGRNGRTVWEGRLEDPGRSAGRDGQVWDLTAMGPSAHAQDQTAPLIYVDTSLSNLVRADNVTPGATDTVGGDPGAPTGTQEALVLQFPDGLHVTTNSRVVMRYTRLMETGQQLARIDYTWDGGVNDANFDVDAVCRTDGNTGGGEVARTDNLATAGGGSSIREIVTNWTAGRNTVEWRLIRSAGGAATIGVDTYWASIRNLVVMATRFNADGTERVAAADYGANTVLAHEVVRDLLGRLLTSYDGANANIDTTSYAITQLAYFDGVTAAQVFEDLMRLEPAYRWGAYESNAAGKHRFEWRLWPTVVRYEADVLDGYDAPGSADGLYDSVMVRWRDTKGAVRTTRRTSSVPVLTAAGIPRQAMIDLGDDIGSSTEATQAGDQYLAEHAYAPNAGRLTVARPVLDLVTGRMVQPWEIKAGELIRVRGILPRIDALNASARDGVTVFRIWSREYRVSSAAATLELDSYSATTARALADLRSRPVTRRR